ncbi:MAG: TetR/AcrR family transcriptional regulator [Gammaproteobacteria bacterium]|nr:MAG: TetR/AcrR family transcriptional regulator [Gammaproteobacteria bacterium]
MALSAERRQRILDAATDVFCQSGFGRASMDAVARGAGVSKATLYNHFASKDVLFQAVVEQVSGRFIAGIDTPGRKDQPIRQSLEEIGREFLAMLLDARNLAAVRLIIGEVQGNPEVGQKFYHAGPEKALKALEAFFVSRREAGEWTASDPQRSARDYVAVLRGNLFWRALLGLPVDSTTVERHVRQAVSLFLRAHGVEG